MEENKTSLKARLFNIIIVLGWLSLGVLVLAAYRGVGGFASLPVNESKVTSVDMSNFDSDVSHATKTPVLIWFYFSKSDFSWRKQHSVLESLADQGKITVVKIDAGSNPVIRDLIHPGDPTRKQFFVVWFGDGTMATYRDEEVERDGVVPLARMQWFVEHARDFATPGPQRTLVLPAQKH